MFDKLKDPHLFFVFLCIWSVIALPILWHWKILVLPKDGKSAGKMTLMSPLIAFLLFVGTCIFVPPMIKNLLHYLDTHGLSTFSKIETEKLPQLIAIITSCLLLLGFNCVHPKEVRTRIWGAQGGLKYCFFACAKGMGICLLTYPMVMLLVQVIHMVVDWLGFFQYGEQTALVELKTMRGAPVLFFSFAIAIVTLIPIIEEFLFRGLLQNFCCDFLSAKGAIIITSLLFALFHYSASQAAANIELMVGLVVYSYFMGVGYVREKTLWTTIGMHGTFNALSLLCMTF